MDREIKTTEQRSNQQFISHIYQEYERLMYYTVRKYIADMHQCEDVVQDSLEKLIEKVEVLRILSEPALANYIVVTVKNTSINYLKRYDIERVRIEELYRELVAKESYSQSLDEILISKETCFRLKKVWPNLDEETRRLLEGKYFLGYDDRKLAMMFGCKPNSIRMKLTRARRTVLCFLKEGDPVE